MSENNTTPQTIQEKIIASVKSKFTWIANSDFERTYNLALSNYLLYKFPSDNNRPSPENLNIDFIVENWLIERMIDILDRAGGNVLSYSENGIDWEYAASNIDPSLINRILPMAAVPR